MSSEIENLLTQLIQQKQNASTSLYDMNVLIPAGNINVQEFNVQGDYVRCTYASSDFEIAFGDSFSDFDQQNAIPWQPYRKIAVRNKYPEKDLEVKLKIGTGYMEDNRFFMRAGGVSQISPQIWEQGNVVIKNPADAFEPHPKKIAEYSDFRVELMVQNVSDTVTVRVGNTAQNALNGLKIEAGGTATFTTSSEFYAAVADGLEAELVIAHSLNKPYDIEASTIQGTVAPLQTIPNVPLSSTDAVMHNPATGVGYWINKGYLSETAQDLRTQIWYLVGVDWLLQDTFDWNQYEDVDLTTYAQNNGQDGIRILTSWIKADGTPYSYLQTYELLK